MFQFKSHANTTRDRSHTIVWLALSLLAVSSYSSALKAEDLQNAPEESVQVQKPNESAMAESNEMSSGSEDQYRSHTEASKGPNGGRLLSKENGISVELAIVEKNMPPKYRAWIRDDKSLITSDDAQLAVILTRLGEDPQTIGITPVDGEAYWQSHAVIHEPHSFDVSVTLQYDGNDYRWDYPSHEARMQMSAEMAQKQGVETDAVSAGEIAVTTRLYGNVVLSPDNISHVTARFPGQITSVRVAYGDSVKKGQVLATVESNNSLQSYSVRAPLSGIITAKQATSGEAATDQALFTITDTSQLWAELKVFPKQSQTIAVDQPVRLIAAGNAVQSSIQQMLPNTEQAPYLIARVPLTEIQHSWFPGMLVEADVTVQQKQVPLRIPNSAIQRLNNWQVAFIKVGDRYQAKPLELGLSDGNYTEVLSGLRPGDEIVVGNSYLIKADLEKSGAAHAH